MGILFETDSDVYGAPGEKEDYDEFFIEGENRGLVLADITITGDSVMRGWGTKFPEIQFIKLERLD